jgi:hypothetical protein
VSLLGVGVGQQQREFLAAQARDRVVRAHHVDERARRAAQHLVAVGMAMGVVDRLEVVEVQRDDRDRPPVARGARQLLPASEMERALIRQAGERILGCLALQAFDQARVRQRDRRLRRVGAERRGVVRQEDCRAVR